MRKLETTGRGHFWKAICFYRRHVLWTSAKFGSSLAGHGKRGATQMPLELSMDRHLEALNEPGMVWGESVCIQSLNRMVQELSGTHIPVLLLGETGTGKEIYARAIHRLAGGEAASFHRISCASLDAVHFHNELGNLRETARHREKPQTVFLDEVDGINQECQRLLLAWLDEGETGQEAGPGARLISATTVELEKEAESGRFRRQLYFRLNGACLRLPALRERLEDLPAFIGYFLNRHAQELQRKAPELNRETMEALLSYDWPGNIRELENVARKMVALGETSLAIADLRIGRMLQPQGATSSERLSSLKVAARAASRQTERQLILQALERTRWNRKQAARELQISYKSLLYKLKQIETLGTKSDK